MCVGVEWGAVVRDLGARELGWGRSCLDFGGLGQESGEQRPDGVAQVLGAARNDVRGGGNEQMEG
jgi:hypothetical protein